MKGGNVSAKEALKSLGSVYLHNRDVCAQEAVYRLTNMHLKECSRKVVFCPTGENVVRMSLPIKVLRQKAASGDVSSEDMWMTSLVDRYKNRPNDSIFNEMCLSRSQVAHLEKRNNVMCKDDGLALVKSLNETQLYVFYQVRHWCLEKMSGKNPDPLHVFVTGGAGTRKSNLIKAVQYEATRLLSTVCRHPDNVCFVDSSYGH